MLTINNISRDDYSAWEIYVKYNFMYLNYIGIYAFWLKIHYKYREIAFIEAFDCFPIHNAVFYH